MTAAELSELGDEWCPRAGSISWAQLVRLCRNRSIALLTFSYVCMNYVYYLIGNWCFLYLIQERHFAILEGGWLAAAPPLAAAVGAGVGGQLAGFLCVRFGIRWGFRLVPLVALPGAGGLLLLGVFGASPYMAVVALAGCFAVVELTEGPFWAATMYVACNDSCRPRAFSTPEETWEGSSEFPSNNTPAILEEIIEAGRSLMFDPSKLHLRQRTGHAEGV